MSLFSRALSCRVDCPTPYKPAPDPLMLDCHSPNPRRHSLRRHNSIPIRMGGIPEHLVLLRTTSAPVQITEQRLVKDTGNLYPSPAELSTQVRNPAEVILQPPTAPADNMSAGSVSGASNPPPQAARRGGRPTAANPLYKSLLDDVEGMDVDEDEPVGPISSTYDRDQDPVVRMNTLLNQHITLDDDDEVHERPRVSRASSHERPRFSRASSHERPRFSRASSHEHEKVAFDTTVMVKKGDGEVVSARLQKPSEDQTMVDKFMAMGLELAGITSPMGNSTSSKEFKRRRRVNQSPPSRGQLPENSYSQGRLDKPYMDFSNSEDSSDTASDSGDSEIPRHSGRLRDLSNLPRPNPISPRGFSASSSSSSVDLPTTDVTPREKLRPLAGHGATKPADKLQVNELLPELTGECELPVSGLAEDLRGSSPTNSLASTIRSDLSMKKEGWSSRFMKFFKAGKKSDPLPVSLMGIPMFGAL